MIREKILCTLEEIKTISDPFRLKILLLFNSGCEAMTVKQMAVKLKEIPSKVHYHVKELERIGVLEIVETKEKGGVIEKFYLPTAESFKVEKNIGVLDEGDYNQAGENIFSIMQQDFIESNKLKTTEDKSILNYGLEYLTDDEVEELRNLIREYLENKDAKEGAKVYMFGYALFRKFNNEEEDSNGGKHRD